MKRQAIGNIRSDWSLPALITLVVIALSAAATAPWAIYWYGLRYIDGRPTAAVQAATAEQVDRLFRQLKMTQPVRVNPISPYTYFLQGVHPDASARLAWIIARSFNAEHVADRRMPAWQLSGMALTIWLTRNWTSAELVAKAAELCDLGTPVSTLPTGGEQAAPRRCR